MKSEVLFFAAMCVLSLIQMPVYCFYKLKGKGRAYTISKCAGSLIFVLTALGSLFFSVPDAYSVLIIAAMLLSAAGDYLLSRTASHRLKIGGCTFAAAHICFIASFIYAAGFNWLSIPVVLALFAVELLAAKLLKLKSRGVGTEMSVYIIIVSAMAVSAVFMLVSDELRVPMSAAARIMTMLGSVMFLVSDLFWMTYGMIFSSAKASLKIANVLTYFPAQMLIAGALLFR